MWARKNFGFVQKCVLLIPCSMVDKNTGKEPVKSVCLYYFYFGEKMQFFFDTANWWMLSFYASAK